MRVLIDLCNSPHVLFFNPIVSFLKQHGHNVLITARDNAQTIPLIEGSDWDYKRIGQHCGKGKLAKLFGLFGRTFRIVIFILRQRVELSVSSSYDCVLASWLTGRRSLFFTDNEKANQALLTLCLHMATKVATPRQIPLRCWTELGVSSRKLIRYPGLKEEIYLLHFVPCPTVLNDLGVSRDQKIIVMRPEPNLALYYNGPSDVLINPLRELIPKDVQIIILPRTQMQKTYYTQAFGDRVIIPEDVVDGPSLICCSDLVIGAGGTMNREAVVLGTSVISTYHGKLLEVDKWLIANGYMKHSLAPTLEEIEYAMRNKKLYIMSGESLDTITDELSTFLH